VQDFGHRIEELSMSISICLDQSVAEIAHFLGMRHYSHNTAQLSVCTAVRAQDSESIMRIFSVHRY
jgi:hypothetical protein